MSKFKVSGDISRTVILGMLAQRQMHGYEIKKRFGEALGESAEINFGSIYYGLKSLTDSGLVDHLRDEPGQGSPERSIYRITARGRSRLAELIEASLGQAAAPLHPLEVGLRFMDQLPPAKVGEIIAGRYAGLKRDYDSALAAEVPKDEPAWAAAVREYRLYRLGAEVLWLKNLLSTLKAE